MSDEQHHVAPEGAQRLFGAPGAEQLYDEPAAVWENDIDTHRDDEAGPWLIEEWTTQPPRYHLPSADWVIEHIQDYWLADNAELDEYGFDAWCSAASAAEVEPVLQAWADRVGYRMAHEHIATHRVTIVDGEPYLNGEPLYVKRADA